MIYRFSNYFTASASTGLSDLFERVPLRKDILRKSVQYRDAAVLAQALVIEPINLVDMINFCNVVIHVLIQTCVI